MVLLLLPEVFLQRIAMCLLSPHLQIRCMFLMWKRNSLVNGQGVIPFICLEDFKNSQGRLSESPFHHLLIQLQHLSTVQGMILFCINFGVNGLGIGGNFIPWRTSISDSPSPWWIIPPPLIMDNSLWSLS